MNASRKLADHLGISIDVNDWRPATEINAIFIVALREFLGLVALDNPRVCGCMRSREWEAVLPIREDFFKVRLPTARDRCWNMRNARARMGFGVR